MVKTRTFYAAAEEVESDLIVWGCGTSKREALRNAARAATLWHRERVPQSVFELLIATPEMVRDTAEGYTLLVDKRDAVRFVVADRVAAELEGGKR